MLNKLQLITQLRLSLSHITFLATSFLHHFIVLFFFKGPLYKTPPCVLIFTPTYLYLHTHLLLHLSITEIQTLPIYIYTHIYTLINSSATRQKKRWSNVVKWEAITPRRKWISGEAHGPLKKTSPSSTTSPITAKAAGTPSPAVLVSTDRQTRIWPDFIYFFLLTIFCIELTWLLKCGCRTKEDRKELQAEVAKLPPPRRPPRQHHPRRAASHPRAPFPMGKSVCSRSDSFSIY